MVKYLRWVFNLHDKRRLLLFLIMVAFLLTFLIARFVSVKFGYEVSIFFKGYHIHHFYFGMLVSAVGGIIGVLSEGKRASRIAAVLVGVGIGLFVDEIGLLLNCTTNNRLCAYVFPDIFDILVFVTGTFLSLIIFIGFVDEYQARNGK